MTATQRKTRLAVPLVWAVAMILARNLGPWIPIAFAALGMSAVVLAADRMLMRELFRPALRPMLLGLAAGTVMVSGTYLLFPLFARAPLTVGQGTDSLYATFLGGQPTLAVLLFVIPIIAAEEILWRGSFQEWAASLSGRPVGTVVISAAVYAIAHAPFGSGLLVAVAFACGLYWSALRSVSGSLIPALIAHLMWDLALILIPLQR